MDLKQRLAAILAADAVGYSRLMSLDERTTVAALDAAHAVFRARIEAQQGRVIDMAGDSVLAVFGTAGGAVAAALAIQAQRNLLAEVVPDQRCMRFRVGVHLGDVTEKADGTVYGDGKSGQTTTMLRQCYFDVVRGNVPDHAEWRTLV